MSTVRPQLEIPVGFRFLPTKEEILRDYLQPFIKGDPIPSGVMKELDIYGANREPWNIFDQDSAESLGYHEADEEEQIKNRKNRGRWMLAPTIYQRSEELGRRRSHRL
ncbi:NAC domain-containing protein 41-like [Gossypium arboreum]|uniref:NAC domain-containing protein 41-like n=1 Tax=Gossypium arboreum TaxID=29729 RepID=UPI0022F1D5E2|nr:NAC domain-containing protein 41-like [Gossypium arboreum]XP_052876307.1 NAC domain-containing protein 41-like [Gossypium arboreum]